MNENDTVSVEEIEFGDNDTLSALVAKLTTAEALVILTDIDGLYDDDPRKNSDAKLIRVVEQIGHGIRDCAGGAGSRRGTGGMITKLHAGDTCDAGGHRHGVF